MTETEFYKKISVRVNNGSGCIFIASTEDYAYVLTVRHNIEDGEKKLLEKGNINVINNDGNKINVLERYIHPNDDKNDPTYIDLALLKIDYPGIDFPQYYYSNGLKGDICRVFGYPRFKKGDYSSFHVEYDLQKTAGVDSHIKSKDPLSTFNTNEVSSITGFSGSGIFSEVNGRQILKGIFPRLDDPNATFRNLIAYEIDCFNTIIEENDLAELKPNSLYSFDKYLDQVLCTVEPEIKSCFNDSMKNVLESGISPNDILDHLKGMLFIPKIEDYKSHVLDENIWVGWLELLLIQMIFKQEDKTSLLERFKEYKMYYSKFEGTSINVFIMRLLQGDGTSVGEYVNDGECLIFNSNSIPAKKILSKEKIEKILPDITRDKKVYEHSWDNDEPNPIPRFSCAHLSHFTTEIGQLEADEYTIELIKEKINELFENASN